MTDDMVEVVVRVPRQVAEKAKAVYEDTGGLSIPVRSAFFDYARAALLETDLTPPRCPTCDTSISGPSKDWPQTCPDGWHGPPPDVVVVDGVRLTSEQAEVVRGLTGTSLWTTDTGVLVRAVRDALLAQEAEPPAPEPDTPLDDLLYEAWGIIANAHGGDWSDASGEWREAAKRWRDRWHQTLPADEEPAPAPEPIEVGCWVKVRGYDRSGAAQVLAQFRDGWVVGFHSGHVRTAVAADLTRVPAPEGEAT